MGPRGDVIVEADWVIGELIKTLEEEGLLENTLIVFSSDNGPVLNDGYFDEAVEKLGNHKPSGPLRGGKYSLNEAGVRVPFITYWKGKINPKVSNALVCQLDLLNSIAMLVDSDAKAKDSQNLLPVLLGTEDLGREELVIEATTRTAFRKADWLMIPPYEGNPTQNEVNIEVGNSNQYQLYNLKNDIGQQHNMANSNEVLLNEIICEFEKIRGEDYKNIEKIELK